MATDISEAGLEKIISDYLVEVNGYELGKAAEFSKEYALDEGRVLRFLQATQPEKVKAAHIPDSEYERNKFQSAQEIGRGWDCRPSSQRFQISGL